MLMSTHIVDVGYRKAVTAMRARPDPKVIDGLRYAETWLMSPLRTGILPSPEVNGVAMIAAWDDDDALDRFLSHPLAKPFENGWRARYEPVRTVGAWPPLPDLPRQEQPTDDQPVAVLTMARMRLPRVRAFAAAAAPAEREAQNHPAFLAGASLMRPPSLISTFTLWRNAREMRQYVVGSYPGGHREAMRKHEERVFHHETVFVRLRPYAVEGQWNGRNPLDMLEPLPAG
ncbi:MAG: spheroidene monooxygenase [Actinomycetota bacterium]|nr:spheroidene monooxygenase [Actinomycetota bacterium]MDQ2956170.1 spheroidene monooxygenase [Actinomycetota bacterium]